ncbi:MAG: pentapeptide repeat-containing protein [Hyphomicrobium sp.]|uniref:pentapeptide repeat-containing protein n=1 Tax=Hyphomicrobium sp. TaxID=82 RepID=UPI001327BB98|nr:pentapeptide repeat-containing protein [Hyphomicrobium sp.]KAB2937051.1 MAG: pentapeptide repeat-containing protein [Hyphomicrobium sp.]MBZ0211241.1 pentapeptide repeat-containing protein [Hyphomicrobium sp.]
MSKRKTDLSEYLTDSQRLEYKDKAVRSNIVDSDWSNLQLVRLVAIGRRFTKVSFANTTFDACYLRDCQFDCCNFTGARFCSTNLHGAKFTGCIFDYATFERTIIDDAVLTDNCPAYENQKMRFARSLRTNYQQIGDPAAANHAIRVELDATEVHLRKAWSSNDHYYRKKYPGLVSRTVQFLSWAKFKLLDYVWGNGESITSLLRAVVVLIAAIAAVDLITNPAPFTSAEAMGALWRAPQIFFGVTSPDYISPAWLTLVTILRLIAFGFFMAILIKRFNRR